MRLRSLAVIVCSSLFAVALSGAGAGEAQRGNGGRHDHDHDHDHGHGHGGHGHHGGSDSGTRPHGGELVKVVREATRRYHDVNQAKADGYQLLFGCVSGPDDGAMGMHYVNLGLVADGVLDPKKPEIVIYEPLPNGKRRIVGADFLIFYDAWHAANQGTPEIMGQLMHLIASPNRYGLPAFYTLHVWAWKPNSTGAFVNWHADVSCENYHGEES